MPNIVIDPAFEGPPASAHGGYACGLLATHLPADAEITLRKPVPLGVPLRMEPHEGGVALFDGQILVAEGVTTHLVDHVPEPPTVTEALAASAAYPGFTKNAFPRCVACGPERTDADAFRIFPGPLNDRDLLAAVWHPTGGAVTDGTIRPEHAWAALDCPAGWAAIWFGRVAGPAVLGRMAAWLAEPVAAHDEHILVGWLEGVSGRKLSAGSALYSPSGALQGFSRQTWIEVRG